MMQCSHGAGLLPCPLGCHKKKKIRYKVRTSDGKVKSYVDKRWCDCPADTARHMHPDEVRS